MEKQNVTIAVEGMSCQHCVRAVKDAVGRLAGVDKVEVSLEGKQAVVSFDPARVGLPAIRAAIEEAGYTVREG